MSRQILFIIIVFFTQTANADLRGLPNVTILASSSLTNPITELAIEYSRQKNITVTASYNSTAEQAWRIEDGESADIFISSHPYWMASLKQMGLIDVYSLTNLVKNKLVLITSAKGKLNEYPIAAAGLEGKLENLGNRTIMSFGDPSNTALGMYTKQAIEKLDEQNDTKLWESLNAKTIKSLSSKNNLYLIAQGETAGIVYYSDARGNDEVRILNVVDENLHEPIIYQAAVVAGENMAHARDFLEFIQKEESKQVFKKHGFIID